MKLIMLSNGMAPEKAILETNQGQFVEVEVGVSGNISVRVFQHDTSHDGETHIFAAWRAPLGDGYGPRWFITYQTETQMTYNGAALGPPVSTSHCVCQDCVTPQDERRIELDDASVWEEGSDGWEGPMSCDRCGRDLNVIINAEDGG